MFDSFINLNWEVKFRQKAFAGKSGLHVLIASQTKKKIVSNLNFFLGHQECWSFSASLKEGQHKVTRSNIWQTESWNKNRKQKENQDTDNKQKSRKHEEN